MFGFVHDLLIMLFFISILGYILVVIKEKLLLKKNIILIDNKHVKQEDLDETDITTIILKGNKVRSGDEIKLVTKEKKTYYGIILGVKRSEAAIHMISHTNEIVVCKIENILKFKVVSKYGKFLN